jgi:invasion protein IalB
LLACLPERRQHGVGPAAATAPGASPKPAPGKSKIRGAIVGGAVRTANGASSISETCGDWTVNCRLLEGQCLPLQAQGDTQTKRRIFEIQLRTPKDGKTGGAILMPSGLKLDSGAILSLDDATRQRHAATDISGPE